MDNLKSKSATAVSMIVVKSSKSNSVESNGRKHNSNVAYSLWPIHFFSRFFGLMPFSIVCANGEIREAQVKRFDYIWFIGLFCLYFSLAVNTSIKLKIPQDKNESITLNIGDDLILIAGLLLGSFMTVMGMYNRFKLINIIQQFESFDKEVKVFDICISIFKNLHRLNQLKQCIECID